MDVFQSVILGAVQGLTEFIPVSSSGHLLVITNLFRDSTNAHLFVQTLDIGTTLALIIFFRQQIVGICRQVFVQHDYRLLRNVIITCLPVGTIGLLLSKFIESSGFFASSLVIAIALAIVGLLMVFLEKLPRLAKAKDGAHLTPGRALTIGLAQCVALVPGTSRSGSTIIAARLMGLEPKEAAEYSFLVSIPVMLGLIVKLLIGDTSFIVSNWQSVLVGNLVAFIAGIIAIKYLLDYLGKHSLRAFGVYRLVVAALIVCLLAGGVLIH